MSQPGLSEFAREAGLTQESLRHIMAGNDTRKIKMKDREDSEVDHQEKNVKKIKKKHPSSSQLQVPSLFYRPCFSQSDIDDIAHLLSQKGWTTSSQNTQQITAYKKFLANPSLPLDQICKFHDFYTIIRQQGGILQSLSTDNFLGAVRNLSQKYNLVIESLHDYFLLYKYFILNYEMYLKEQKKQYCPCNIGYPQVLPLRIYFKARDTEQDVLRRDCLKIEQFLQQIPQKIQQNFIKQTYGSQQIQTTIQFRHSHAILSPQIYQEKSRRSLSDYYNYQNRYQQAFRQGKPLNARLVDVVQSAVNISSLTKPQVNYAIRKTLSDTSQLQYLSNQDILSYMDYMLDGFNIPQLAIRARESWTGCQQQPYSFCSLCLCHGPGQNQWLVLHQQYSSDLKQQVKKQFGIDISKHAWYPDVNWFILRNYPIKKVLQKQGDLLFFGAGSLRWSRTVSTNTISFWSIMPKTEFQLQLTQKRINIQQQVSCLIPIKTIILRWFNHQYHAFDSQYVEQMVQQWVDQQLKYFQNIKMKPEDATCIYIFDQDTFCSVCKKQIFLFFVMTSKLHCLKCCKKSEREAVSMKFRISDVKLLLYRNKTYRETGILNEIPEVLDLCHGQFAGYINYCWQNKRCYTASNVLIQETRKSERNSRFVEQQDDLRQLKSKSPKHIKQKKPKGEPKPVFKRFSQTTVFKPQKQESDIDRSVEITHVSRSRSRKRRQPKVQQEFKKPKEVRRKETDKKEELKEGKKEELKEGLKQEFKNGVKEEEPVKQQNGSNEQIPRKPRHPDHLVIPVIYPDATTSRQHYGIFTEMRAKTKLSQEKFTDVVPVIPPNNIKEPNRQK